jgi:hypothetical protein
MSELVGWDSFYVIIASAAGALIGLQFVAVTPSADRPPLRAAEAGAAFATPTVVYFTDDSMEPTLRMGALVLIDRFLRVTKANPC